VKAQRIERLSWLLESDRNEPRYGDDGAEKVNSGRGIEQAGKALRQWYGSDVLALKCGISLQ
jgi:hypothetical protein